MDKEHVSITQDKMCIMATQPIGRMYLREFVSCL